MGNAQRKLGQQSARAPYSSGSSKKVHWDGPGIPAPPGKPVLIPGDEEAQPDIVNIRWERSSSSGGSAIIGYYVEHRKLGSPHWERSAPVLCTYPELTLSGLEPGWRYQFRIRAQNALGLSEPSELSDPLAVTLQRAASIQPKFDQELKDCLAIEGKQAEFTVSFSGLPIPKVTWFKDGFEIICSRRIDIKTDCNKSSLLINRTMIDDEGEIKCSATNRAGHVSTRAKLTIEVPAYVRMPGKYDEGLLYEQGDEIKLRALYGGRPPPSITWYHEGGIIVADERIRFESTTENETILVLSDCSREDRGEYTVRAINKHGERVAACLVTVIDRPAPPGKVMITRKYDRSVSLAWKEPEDDGGCKIGSYLVEYHRMGWDMWLKSTTCRQTTVTLNDLIEGSEYEFRVKAENLYGLSDPSEKSDVVFVPDVKRGLTENNMRMRSASSRDIPRGRSERREVSFHEPAQRTRSLTREEASNREAMAAYERTTSPQRLVRSSRADSRVTFALDTTSRERHEPRRQWSKETLPQPGDFEILGRARSPQPAIVMSPSVNGQQRPYLEARGRSISYSREHSPSPLVLEESMEVAIKQTVESMRTTEPSPPPAVPRRRRGSSGSLARGLAKPSDEPDMLHGSSEFMLVLYPGAEDRRQYESERLEKNSEVARRETRTAQNDRLAERPSSAVQPAEEDEEDLLPPPMSLSLPELFSAEHQIVETIREAVSSTELLHERAMERFYRAIEAEQSAEEKRAKAKALAEPRKPEPAEAYPLFKPRARSIRRRTSGGTAASVIGWQLKQDRRRSSEGEAKGGVQQLLLRPPAAGLPQSAISDPNLPTSDEQLAQKVEPWIAAPDSSPERLRRWHELGIDLSNEESIAALIDKENSQNNRREEMLKLPEIKSREPSKERTPEIFDEVAPDEILAEDSIETSGVSSEAESVDSEDLKQLKARIMAIPVLEEEDTYHPRGRMVLHAETEEPPPVPPHRSPLIDVSLVIPDRTDLSPTNSSPASPNGTLKPKSILKKRTDTDPLPVNQFGRPIPPEKPIRKSLPPYDELGVTLSNRSLSNQDFRSSTPTTEFYTTSSVPVLTAPSVSTLPPTSISTSPSTPISLSTPSPIASPVLAPSIAATSTPSPSPTPTTQIKITSDTDSDKEAVISAGEAAVTKRKQMRQGSKTQSSQESEEEHEEKMAVVSHYTELVRQYSHPDFRQRSQSRDREIRRYESPSQTRVASPTPAGPAPPKKEKLPVTPGKIIEPISPIVPLLSAHTASPAKIITPIPPVIPSSPIQRAVPILQSERSSRRGSFSSRANESDSDVSSRGRSRDQQQRPVSEGGRPRKASESRGTTPTRRRQESGSARSGSRPPSRNESPMPRSRNVSRDRSAAESRSSSTTREPRQRAGRTRASRPTSRASSRERSRAATPTEAKIERLQRALEDRDDRLRRLSGREGARLEEEVRSAVLSVEAERKVRSTLSYFTDVALLMAALYLYLFKKEILAVPIIALLLYRYVQQELKGWLPGWRRSGKRS